LGDGRWMDVGSGGGSPAIPLKIAHPSARLTMVESRSRKAAFLREVSRQLELSDTSVENERVEALADRSPEAAELITVRAVRLDAELTRVLRGLLQPSGRLAMFCPAPLRKPLPGFNHMRTIELLQDQSSYLGLYSAAFHVEQSR